MARVQVSRECYKISFIVYYMLCLLGLIWQIMQISEIFFQFNVVKNINVFKPEDMDVDNKILHIGFLRYDMISKTKYKQLTGKNYSGLPSDYEKIPLDIIFESSHTADELFSTGNQIMGEYLAHKFHCFTMKYPNVVSKSVPKHFSVDFIDGAMEHGSQPNSHAFVVGAGDTIYPFNSKRLLVVPFGTTPKNSRIRSHSYHLMKLSSPYTDHCFNYKIVGKEDRYDAINIFSFS